MLSKRLLKIASLVPICNSMADIGTDHGYLPRYLIDNNKCNSAILCDVNKMPLENAKKNFTPNDHVAFRLGSGIEPISEKEIDCVVIAGMGGGLIRSILEKDIEKSKRMSLYVIQPQTEQGELRTWLLENGYIIYADSYVKDMGKYYEIIVMSHESNKVIFSEDVFPLIFKDAEFGKNVLKRDLNEYREFLIHKQKKYQRILEHLPLEDSFEDKRLWCIEKLKTIDNILRGGL